MENKLKQGKKRESNVPDIIAEAAAVLFEKKGYTETSMHEISDAVRLSKGSIYYYFPKKHEILFHILNKYMDLTIEGLEKELKEPMDNLSRVRQLISFQINFYVKNMSIGKILFHEAYLLPQKYRKIVFDKERKYRQMVADVLSDFLEHSITKDESTALTFTLIGMCNWPYSWYNPRKSLTVTQLVDIVSDLFCDGLRGYKTLIKKLEA